MLKRKFTKIIFVLFCIITLVMPYTTNVLAAKITSDDTQVYLQSITVHEGGEASGTLTPEQEAIYDNSIYEYFVGGTSASDRIWKIVTKDGDSVDYQNIFYCINATKVFPAVDDNGNPVNALQYTNVADLKDSTSAKVKALHFSADFGSETWTKNYNSLLWLFDNFYLKNAEINNKDEYLTKAFAGSDYDVDVVKAILTDDDIDVVQQYAIWYFTNNDFVDDGDPDNPYQKFNVDNLPAVNIAKLDTTGIGTPGSYRTVAGDTYENRQDMANILFRYLVNTAKNPPASGEKVYPTLVKNDTLPKKTDANYHVVGPYKVTSGNVDSSEYKITLTDQNNNKLSTEDYKILINGETEFTTQDVDEILDKDFYVYIPKTNSSVNNVSLNLEYTTYETISTLWENSNEEYQPVTLLERKTTPHSAKITYPIDKSVFDLALRKYIVSVNGKSVSMSPTVDVTPLKNGENTAKYIHPKTPVEVSAGDRIVFAIRVYNEGNIDATNTVVLDALPEGLEYVEDSEINRTYGWVKDKDVSKTGEGTAKHTNYKTDYLKNTTINGFNRETGTELSSADVQIEVKIANNVDANSVLTNIAEIMEVKGKTETGDIIDVNDRDSDENNNPYQKENRDSSNYTGSDTNPEDLSRTDTFYQGLQDDDDFAKIKIKGKVFDLALRKYIVKVNNNNVNMAPTVNISPLKNGGHTAEYRHPKTPVEVSSGDTVVFEIRVYNEGDIDATNLVIVDALPEGLEFVENSTINNAFGWTKSEEYSKNDDGTGMAHINYVAEIKNKTITAFDKENGTKLDSAYVQIECKIADNVTDTSVLTNIAEIKDCNAVIDGDIIDDIEERDSSVNSNDYQKTNADSTNYIGDRNNPTDLTKTDFHYKGIEDDDDFAKVKIKGKIFDLNLKKFISKVNGEDVTPTRQPVVKLEKLKSGISTDADYELVKAPLTVSKGDIITYTLRVYNEGEKAGYAEEISDYLPEGLGFIVGYKDNVDNMWSIPQDAKTVKLSTIENGTKNLKTTDFSNVSDLNEVDIVTGKAKLASSYLASSTDATGNLIKAFDKENGTALDYKDIKVTCIVLTDEVSNNNLRNIAEIIKEADENKEIIPDIDSTPDTVNPDKYPDTEKRPDGTKQDDNDYEELTTPVAGKFDLSLQKFITKVNDSKVTGREPTVSKTSDGKIKFTKSNTNALAVENNDLVTYTIRVYNEGTIDGYAKEIADNIPNGLEFVANNETNKKYGWKLVDKNGNETSDVKQAASVVTDYLSKAASEKRSEDALLKAFDSTKAASTISYKDVEIVFKVVEAAARNNSGRNAVNIAEITNDEDANGNPIEDIDSTPGNNKTGEDDIDQEKVYVKYFDLALRKTLSRIIINEDGKVREIAVSPTDGLQKVEIHKKKIASTVVKFVYDITVTNEGQIAGYATEITDYVPDGLEFIQEDNKSWTQESSKVIKTPALSNTLLQPGQSSTVQVVFKWINGDNNLGLKTNIAEISADRNDSNTPDIDSVPGNNKPGEDDIDSADVMLAISTGTAPTYIALTMTVLAILTTGIVLIKKHVLQ